MMAGGGGGGAFTKYQKLTSVSIKQSWLRFGWNREWRAVKMKDNLVVVRLQCDKLELRDSVVIQNGQQEEMEEKEKRPNENYVLINQSSVFEVRDV